ncbi:PREDICTED: uncharacterized protein LOC101298719 [Fragaria vesca subsp. vesca]
MALSQKNVLTKPPANVSAKKLPTKAATSPSAKEAESPHLSLTRIGQIPYCTWTATEIREKVPDCWAYPQPLAPPLSLMYPECDWRNRDYKKRRRIINWTLRLGGSKSKPKTTTPTSVVDIVRDAAAEASKPETGDSSMKVVVVDKYVLEKSIADERIKSTKSSKCLNEVVFLWEIIDFVSVPLRGFTRMEVASR